MQLVCVFSFAFYLRLALYQLPLVHSWYVVRMSQTLDSAKNKVESVWRTLIRMSGYVRAYQKFVQLLNIF